MFKLIITSILSLILLTACDKQKAASATVGGTPKQVIDQTTNDIDRANKLADEQLKAAETETTPAEPEK